MIGVTFLDEYRYRRVSLNFRELLTEEEKQEKAKARKEKDVLAEEKLGKSVEEYPHADLETNQRLLIKEVEMFVVVKSQFLPDLFTLVMTLMIIMNTVNMGAQLDLAIIKKVFKKPIGPAVGFVSQFILMPLVLN